MKKLFVKYDYGSKTIYTMENQIDHMKYVRRHIDDSDVFSMVLQQYPKKDNTPVVYK